MQGILLYGPLNLTQCGLSYHGTFLERACTINWKLISMSERVTVFQRLSEKVLHFLDWRIYLCLPAITLILADTSAIAIPVLHRTFAAAAPGGLNAFSLFYIFPSCSSHVKLFIVLDRKWNSVFILKIPLIKWFM